jgi:TRAP-type C4-dicarboxylate transport system substrate-binding protein
MTGRSNLHRHHRTHRAGVQSRPLRASHGVISVAAATCALLAVLSGCTKSSKARVVATGSPVAEKPVVLTLASGDSGVDAAGEFVNTVAALSGGAIQIKVIDGLHPDDVNYERELIGDVRGAGYDLAQVGARAWDSVDVLGFRPLVAPFLVDSYALEASVIASPVADDALASVRPLGLVGIALIPGEIRHPIGVARTIRRPSDLKGLRVGVRPSQVAEKTFRAMGAVPIGFVGGDLAGLGALETDLYRVKVNGFQDQSKAATTNVSLWTRMQTVVMNQRSYDKLTPVQRNLLHQAGLDAVQRSVGRIRAAEAHAVATLCLLKYPLIQASPQDLTAFEAAAAPVIAELNRDKTEATDIAAIRHLAAAITPNNAAPPTCPS